MVIVCCVCHKVKKDSQWVEEPIPTGSLPSHGYCPECAALARAELAMMQLQKITRLQILTQAAVA